MINCNCCGAKLSRIDDEHICDKRYYEKLRELADLKAKCEAYEAMLANADSIRIPTDNDGHFTTVNKVAGQGIQTKHLAGKWQAGPNYEEIYFDTALEAYAAIKPNAAAGEEGTE